MGSRRRGEQKALNQRNSDVGGRLQKRCWAIQQFLLEKTTGSERSIRDAFGDSPDTSKSLRMLLKQHRVKRFGSGGRSDPFVYMALLPPPVDLERLKDEPGDERLKDEPGDERVKLEPCDERVKDEPGDGSV